MFSRFSRKKAQIDFLKMLEKSVGIELRTFTNHLQTVQMSYDNLIKKNEEIVELLKELNKKK